MTREEKELLLQTLEERDRRYSECPIANFNPHSNGVGGGQKALIDAVKNNIAEILLALPGNRWGKTHALVALAIAHGLGYFPWEVPGLVLEKQADGTYNFPARSQIPMDYWVPRTDGLPINVPNEILLCTGLDMKSGIGGIIQEKWRELWPQKVKFETYLGQYGVWKDIFLPNGSHIALASAQQDKMSFEGTARDAVLCDEPIPRWMFTALLRACVDRCARIVWTATPLGDSNIAWMAADLINDKKRKNIFVVRGSGRDNPFINQEKLESFLNDPTLTEDERRARAEGELGVLGKTIITTYQPQHVLIPRTQIPSEVPRLLVVDPHHARPPVCVWFAVFDDGKRFVAYREWPTEDYEKCSVPSLTTGKLSSLIKDLEGNEKVQWRIVDPQFGRQHAKVLGEQFRSFQEEMADYQLYFDANVDNDVERGIMRLRDAFRSDPLTHRPQIQIMSDLQNSQNSLQLWSYRTMKDGRLAPSETYKDFADCYRYLLGYDLPLLGDSSTYSYLEDCDD